MNRSDELFLTLAKRDQVLDRLELALAKTGAHVSRLEALLKSIPPAPLVLTHFEKEDICRNLFNI